MDSLSPFLQGSFIPCFMPVYPGAPQNSTGPTSIDGKSKSRQNALRDGITCQVTTLSNDARPAFEQLKAEFVADLNPKTTTELRLAHAIAWDMWRLDHVRAIEMNAFALGDIDPANALDCDNPQIRAALTEARTWSNEYERFERMGLYEQRMTRNIHKNLAVLRILQAERQRNHERDANDEIIIANGASTAPSRNGFVFSTAEILAATDRQILSQQANAVLRGLKERADFAGVPDYPDQNQPNSGLRMPSAA